MLATWGCATFPKPTLDLQFAGATSLDSRITFTRASTATYFNSAGVLTSAAINEARFDYDPSTLAARGLLIEEARTNIYTYSEELNNPAWTANGVTVSANAGVSPTGATTADNVIPTAVASAFKEVQQNFSSTLGTTYTFSVFAKSNGYRYVQLIATSASFGTFAINYDLDTGTETAYTAGTSTVLQRSITPIGNGWYRLSVSATAGATSAAARLGCDIIPASDSARGVSWTGNGTSGVLMWGMQLETGAFATSYIPTTTTALTRNADVASMTGTNFSSLYNASEGTLAAEYSRIGAVNFQVIASIGEPTLANTILLIFGSGSPSNNNRFDVNASGSSQASITVLNNPALNTVAKVVGAYAANNFAATANGAAPGTDTSGSAPSGLTNFAIGCNSSLSGGFLNGYLRRITYYPSRLPNTTLQALTA